MQAQAELQAMVDKAKRIVFFGGAGVSTESGIPDFRSVDGLYNQEYDYPPETILSHNFFFSKPDIYYKFHKTRLIAYDAKPNAAHLTLAKLEEMGKLTAVVTQNIDGLHQLAGSKNVIELHGSMQRNYCTECGEFYSINYIKEHIGIPYCSKCQAIIKPDIVLYGESLKTESIENAIYHIANADLLIIGGTSLVVYPAASLIEYFRGDNIVLINKSATSRDNMARLVIREPIAQVFAGLFLP